MCVNHHFLLAMTLYPTEKKLEIVKLLSSRLDFKLKAVMVLK